MSITSLAVHRKMRLSREPAPVPLTDFLHPDCRAMAEALWWTRVGAMLLLNGTVRLAAFTAKYKPTHGEYLDSRLKGLSFGQCVEFNDLLSPDEAIICEGLKRGLSSHGLDLFLASAPSRIVSLRCAKIGIKRLLYAGMYLHRSNVLTLQAGGVEVIRVSV